MQADAGRISELERGFRRDGLPNLIVGLTATEDIFTRATPFLVVVFVVEVVNALSVDAGWTNLMLALGGAILLVGAFGLYNLARRRRFFAIPRRVRIPELATFVLVPALVAFAVDTQVVLGVATIAVNLALVLLTYVVIGFGFIPIVRWAAVRLFAQLAASVPVLVRALPLLLFFSLVTFFTTEIWQSFTATGASPYWTAIIMFVLLGLLFLSVRLPTLVQTVQADSDLGGVPLRRRERLNLAAVALISQALQVLFVSAAVWLFYVVLGALLVSDDVRAEWLTHPENVLLSIDWFGEQVQVTTELLRVSTGVAAFAGLYYAVTIMFDAAYRDQFVDSLTAELQDTFARRTEYHALLQRRGATDVTPS